MTQIDFATSIKCKEIFFKMYKAYDFGPQKAYQPVGP